MLHIVLLLVVGWLCYFTAHFLEKQIEKEKRGDRDDKNTKQPIPT